MLLVEERRNMGEVDTDSGRAALAGRIALALAEMEMINCVGGLIE